MNSKAEVIGISITKLKNSIYDSDAIDGYNTVQNYRNRKGEDVACYTRIIICFNMKTCLSINVVNMFINLMFQKKNHDRCYI